MDLEKNNEEINDISKDPFDLQEFTDTFDNGIANDPLDNGDIWDFLFDSVSLVIAPKLKDKTCPSHEPGYRVIEQRRYSDFLEDSLTKESNNNKLKHKVDENE